MLVEDDVLIRMPIAEELRAAGLIVVEAVNADEALAYLRSGGCADLIFSDIYMPGSIDGLELARRMRIEDPNLPVILTSGNPGSWGAETIGAFIPKPYHIQKVVEMISEMLAQKRAPG
ncbi:MAG TPA: response regulator [Stellaceae bacterium]|nr:response regulator [Stellaceae bacterium]